MRKIGLHAAAVFIVCLLGALPCYAQSAAIANGLTWVSGSQNPDGTWGTQADLEIVNTAEVVNALASSGTGSIASAIKS